MGPGATPQKIVLIGARKDGQAGVVLSIVRQHSLFEVVGFVDDDESLHGNQIDGIPVLGGVDHFVRNVPDNVQGAFICIGDNTVRERCFAAMRQAGLSLVNVIHPSAVVLPDAEIGQGVFIGPNAVIMNHARLGNGVTINTAATIDHDNVVEDFANISPGSHTSGRTTIKTRAFLGSGVITIPGVTVGSDAFVGAGSVVVRDVPDNTKVAGVPARRME